MIKALLTLSSLALVMFAGAGNAYARARAYGYCEDGNKVSLVTGGIYTSTTTPLMRSYPACTVTVYLAGTLTVATVYSDNSGTPKGNPFTGDTFGYWFFYANNARYDVKLSGGGLPSPVTLFDVILTDPANFTTGVTSFNTRTGAVVPASGDYSFSMISGNITVHAHTGNTVGGQLAEGALALTDITTNNSTAGRHGFAPKLSGTSTEFLSGAGTWLTPTITTGVTSWNARTGAVIPLINDYSFSLISGTAAVSQGGTGATTLTGILEGHGTSAFTANAASTMLTYLRRKANVTTVQYEYAANPILNPIDYQFSIAPGGSVAIGANSITLTPCPLGLNGTDTFHYVRLSAGTGTAESVLVNGGTCTSGATTGTVGFTAANTHTGAWTITSASGGIKEAIVAGGDGAYVNIPAGTYSISGTQGLVVDKANVTLVGSGSSSILRALATSSIASVIQVQAQAGKGLKLINVLVDGNKMNTGTDPAAGNGVLFKGNAAGPGGLGASDIIVSGVEITDAFNGLNIADTGGYTSNISVVNGKVSAGLGGGETGILIDTGALKVTVQNVDVQGSDTYITDNSTYGANLLNNYPASADLPYAGSLASAATLTLRCGQVATVTGGTAVATISLPSSADAGCRVTLIPDPSSTWVTAMTGNIGLTSTPIPGVALTLTFDGTSFWPSY